MATYLHVMPLFSVASANYQDPAGILPLLADTDHHEQGRAGSGLGLDRRW